MVIRRLLRLTCDLVLFITDMDYECIRMYLFGFLELSGRLVAEAFYTGELECELRRTGQIGYRFRTDSDREECMAMVERMRRETIYPHSSCTDDCKKRG